MTAGHLTERQDAITGQTVTYTYNDLYFLIERQYTPSSATDTFTYDLSGRMLTNQRTNGSFTWPESFTYDGANRITQSVQGSRTINYSYNIPSRIRMVTYPRRPDDHGSHRPARACVNHINTSPSIVQYAYDLANHMLTRNYANGTTSSYTYNANNWLLLQPFRDLGRIAFRLSLPGSLRRTSCRGRESCSGIGISVSTAILYDTLLV